jgi:hypothetical protein
MRWQPQESDDNDDDYYYYYEHWDYSRCRLHRHSQELIVLGQGFPTFFRVEATFVPSYWLADRKVTNEGNLSKRICIF